MRIEDVPAVPIPPPPRTDQDKYTKTVVTTDANGRTKINEVHYITTIYDYKGSLKEVTRTWSRSFLV